MRKISFALLCVAAVAGAAAPPSPALIVLNKEDAMLVIVDPANGKVTGKVPTGESPHEVVVSADGKTAFVTNYGSKTPGSTLSVIDLISQKEVHRVDLTPMSKPHGIAIADGKVWFTAETNKLVGRYDPATNKIDALLGTGQNSTHMVMFNRDNSLLFTANIAGNSISIFSKAPNAATWNQTVVPVGKGPEGSDLSPDGRELWAANSQDGSVSIIDLASKTVSATFDIGTKRSNRIKFTVDGKHALVSDLAAGELVIVDVAARRAIKRIALGKAPEGIVIEPSGARAFVAVNGDNFIAVIDLNSFTVTGKLTPGNGPDGMAWVGR